MGDRHTQYVDRELTIPVNIVKGAMTPITIPAVGVNLKSVPMETAAKSNCDAPYSDEASPATCVLD